MKEYEMGWLCSAHSSDVKVIQILIKKLKESYYLEDQEQILILKFKVEESVDLVSLAQDKDQWRNLVGAAINLKSFIEDREYFHKLNDYSFFRGSLLHADSYSYSNNFIHGKKGKVIPLHAMEAFGLRGGIAPTHS
jgi:hypothetical protein